MCPIQNQSEQIQSTRSEYGATSKNGHTNQYMKWKQDRCLKILTVRKWDKYFLILNDIFIYFPIIFQAFPTCSPVLRECWLKFISWIGYQGNDTLHGKHFLILNDILIIITLYICCCKDRFSLAQRLIIIIIFKGGILLFSNNHQYVLFYKHLVLK